jgi:hypothetical protein
VKYAEAVVVFFNARQEVALLVDGKGAADGAAELDPS